MLRFNREASLRHRDLLAGKSTCSPIPFAIAAALKPSLLTGVDDFTTLQSLGALDQCSAL